MPSATDQNHPLPSASPEWVHLATLAADVRRTLDGGTDLRHGENRTLSACGIEVDGHRSRLTPGALSTLYALARFRNVERQRDSMFSGGIVNRSEKRPALHVALRAPVPQRHGDAFAREVLPARERMRTMAEDLHAGTMKGSTGEAITDI